MPHTGTRYIHKTCVRCARVSRPPVHRCHMKWMSISESVNHNFITSSTENYHKFHLRCVSVSFSSKRCRIRVRHSYHKFIYRLCVRNGKQKHSLHTHYSTLNTIQCFNGSGGGVLNDLWLTLTLTLLDISVIGPTTPGTMAKKTANVFIFPSTLVVPASRWVRSFVSTQRTRTIGTISFCSRDRCRRVWRRTHGRHIQIN